MSDRDIPAGSCRELPARPSARKEVTSVRYLLGYMILLATVVAGLAILPYLAALSAAAHAIQP